MATNCVHQDFVNDNKVEKWKMNKMLEKLEAIRGNGTSMITINLPPRYQISRMSKLLTEEYGTAANIKSRVNRQSVLAAITSVQQKLRLYPKVPPNGLIIYCGTMTTEEGKEKKVNFDLEPFAPISRPLYMCDSRFHTETLSEMLEDHHRFGFIVMDGQGTLFGTVCGSAREVLHAFTEDLPKKHGRGGQSALRFARLRLEKRHNYLRKVAELAVQLFITNDKINVTGIILAGSADFKRELACSDLFDPRLHTKLVKIVDISYGGEKGFNQAIDLSSDVMSDVRIVQEKALIGRFFEEIAKETGKVCYGVKETLALLDSGAVETLLVWEDVALTRVEMMDHRTEVKTIQALNPVQEKDKTNMIDKETGVDLEIMDKQPLVDWLVENYRQFGVCLELVSDKSQEGAQFVKGFGGLGGILRYKIDTDALHDFHDDSDLEEFNLNDY